MTELVSNIIRPIDLSTTFLTAAAVGGADQAYPDGFVGTAAGPGIDGTSAINYFTNDNNATVVDDWYGAWGAFTSPTTLDMSSISKAFLVHFRVSSGFNSVYQIRISLRSGTGTVNWGYWDFDVNTNDIVTYKVFRVEGTPDGTIGTFDNTDVTGVSLQARVNSTDVYALSTWWDQFLFIDGPVVFEDAGTPTQVSMQSYFDLLKRDSSEDYRCMLVNKAGTTFELGFPVEFRCDDYQDSTVATGLAFMAADGIGIRSVSSGFYQLRFIPPANSTLVFSGFTAATVSADYDLFIDASASGCSLDFNASLFAGVNDVEFSGVGFTIASSNLLSPVNCDLADGLFNNFTIDACDNPVVITSDLTANSVISITNPVSESLQFNLPSGDYSDLIFNLSSSTVNFNSSGTAWDISGISSGGSIEFDNLVSGDVEAVVSDSLTYSIASPTTGGGNIILSTPQTTVDLVVTAIDNSTNLPVQGARVRLTAAAGGSEVIGTVLLEGLTDSSGLISTTYVYSGNQPVTGTVRQGTTQPYYKPSSLGGSITSGGYNVPVSLIRD